VYREIQFLITVLEHEAEGRRRYYSSLATSISAPTMFSIDYELSPFLPNLYQYGKGRFNRPKADGF
jgi:hypothetical protein